MSHSPRLVRRLSRRRRLGAGTLGCPLPAWLQLRESQAAAGEAGPPRACVGPERSDCTAADLHATVFRPLGISPRATVRHRLERPFPVSDGKVLPLL